MQLVAQPHTIYREWFLCLLVISIYGHYSGRFHAFVANKQVIYYNKISLRKISISVITFLHACLAICFLFLICLMSVGRCCSVQRWWWRMCPRQQRLEDLQVLLLFPDCHTRRRLSLLIQKYVIYVTLALLASTFSLSDWKVLWVTVLPP